MDFPSVFLSRAGYVAHGFCITWNPALLWTMVGSDATIAAAYFSIPLAIASFVRRRGDASLNWVAALFCGFIFACGVTHVMDIWTIWRPDYWLQALAKLLTAAVSLATAVVLWPLIPQALRIPGTRRMQGVIDELQAEILRRHSAEDHLVEVERRLAAESESSRLAAIVESSRDAIIGITLDGRITSWNRGAQGIFGYSAQEIVGRPVQMLIPPDHLLEEKRILAEVAAGRDVPAFDTIRRAKDGTLLEMSLTISPICGALGNIVGGAKIARNVSEQRRAERELAESQLRLRFILDAAQVGEWEIDLATRIVTRSVQHDRCFGYETPVADWSIDTFLAHVHPDDRAQMQQSMRRLLTARTEWNDQTRVIWPDGSTHWIRLNGITIRAANHPIRVVGIVADITQWKLAEESQLKSLRLEVENRQFQEATRLKSQFLANMSHELRTPLNAIIGFAELLQSRAIPADSPKNEEFLGYIGASGRHLLQLINDVLDLSKVEAGKLEFFPEEVDLAALIKEVNDILHSTTQGNGIEVSVEVDPALPVLRLDPGRLKQVLFNYLSNAIKFTAEGGRVTVRARLEGAAHVRIEVEDTGIGIAAADLPRLFSEFQQLDAGLDKQHQGTGLGLALTRRLIEAQGGQVGVTSELGRGSVFFVVLNVAHGMDLTAAEETAGRDPVATARGRLLVIDAGRKDQNRLLAALADLGFAIDVPSTGRQAVQFAQRQRYDGITLNLEMPDEPGLAVLESIRRSGASREAPVVGVSMSANSGEAAAFAIADVLTKPLIPREVLSALAPYRFVPPDTATAMVIDDDPASRELMRATLLSIGIEAVCMANGREALEVLRRRRPDAIILDLLMPELDGFAVLDALHSVEFLPAIPVFIWTCMVLTETEYARLAQSAQAIVGKGGGDMPALLEELRRRYPQA
jgi:PAS domain S-box-containing protein